MWLAGGGMRGGMLHGETDDLFGERNPGLNFSASPHPN